MGRERGVTATKEALFQESPQETESRGRVLGQDVMEVGQGRCARLPGTSMVHPLAESTVPLVVSSNPAVSRSKEPQVWAAARHCVVISVC